jgi:hypothetical protein
MKPTIVLLLFVLICSAQCENNSIPEESEYCADTAWLKTIIENAQQNTSKAEVIRYRYKMQTVYYVDSCIGCPDDMAQVYTCSGEVVCQFGGIAGFNTCPDFKDTATDKKVIWKN